MKTHRRREYRQDRYGFKKWPMSSWPHTLCGKYIAQNGWGTPESHVVSDGQDATCGTRNRVAAIDAERRLKRA